MAAASLSKNCLQSTIWLLLLLLMHLNYGGNGETSFNEMEWEEEDAEERRQWSILGVEDELMSSLETSRIKFDAWRLSVETNNARDWKVIPPNYDAYVRDYMTKGQYKRDFKVALDEVLKYMKTVTVEGDGMDAWILDVDDTALSTIPYWRNHLWGAEPYNPAAMSAWIMEGNAPAISTIVSLYKDLTDRNIRVFFISHRNKNEREATHANLEKVGYRDFADLIVRDDNDLGVPMVEYATRKREEIVRNGYRILGIVGDQWSEISGNFTGLRTFKLPNPMYYIG